MPKKGLAILLVMLLAVVPAYAASGFSTDPDLIEEAALSVLMLEIYDSSDELIATGSGFVAYDNKTLVTNYHVIEGAETIVANSDDGYQYIVNKVFVANEEKDIAICGFFSPTNLEPLELNVDGELKRAESVVAIGSPIGITNTVSLGNISAIYEEDGVKWVQFTAPISSGSSGGALFDDNGQVIGVTSATYIDTQNLNLAVHISEVQELYDGWDGESHRINEYAAAIEATEEPTTKPTGKPTIRPTGTAQPPVGETPQPSHTMLPVYGPLDKGDTGVEVANLQGALGALGYPMTKAIGVFDEITAEAVWMFNYINDINGRRVATNITQRVLYHGSPKAYDPTIVTPRPPIEPTAKVTFKPTLKPTNTPMPTYEPLERGDSGEAVKKLQKRLIELGYLQGNADGIFGEKTEYAVSVFNMMNGVVGGSLLSTEELYSLRKTAGNKTQQVLYHGNPQTYKEPDMVLAIMDGAYAEWQTLNGDKLKIHFEVSNYGLQKTAKAFELYVYAEDVWGNRLYDGDVYYDTTEKKVEPGATVYSDYIIVPDASDISKIYCGIHKVAYTDGTTHTVKNVEYGCWTMDD